VNLGHSEIEKFPCQVYHKHFPESRCLGDITKIDWGEFEGRVGLVTGGFPCQPFSVAGKRRGKEDDRHLWPEMLRAIRETRPRWVIGENVAGIIRMELDQVLSDLEAEGYQTEPFLIPACAVNAPHRRDRVWIIAHTGDGGSQERRTENNGEVERGAKQGKASSIFGATAPQSNSGIRNSNGINGDNAGSDSSIVLKLEAAKVLRRTTKHAPDNPASNELPVTDPQEVELNRSRRTWSGREGLADSDRTSTNPNPNHTATSRQRGHGGEILRITESERLNGNGWREPWLEVATRLCRVDARVPNRVDRLKALGNAIVPQVAFEIMKAIREYDSMNQSERSA